MMRRPFTPVFPSRPALPPSYTRMPAVFSRPRFAAALAGVPAVEVTRGLSGVWDDVLASVQKIIPEHTVAGKALKGDYQGAAADASKFAAQTASGFLQKTAKANGQVPGMPNVMPEVSEPQPTFGASGMTLPLLVVGGGLAAFLVYRLARSRG